MLDRLDELVVKPVDGSGGKGIVIGPRATKDELDALRRRVTTDPRGWIAQPVVQLSTVPTLIEDRLAPRHVDLRPFAVNSGDDVWVLPGGLTRVALPEGELVVNSSQGGGSKDTWVLRPSPQRASGDAEPDEEDDDEEDEERPPVATPPGVPRTPESPSRRTRRPPRTNPRPRVRRSGPPFRSPSPPCPRPRCRTGARSSASRRSSNSSRCALSLTEAA